MALGTKAVAGLFLAGGITIGSAVTGWIVQTDETVATMEDVQQDVRTTVRNVATLEEAIANRDLTIEELAQEAQAIIDGKNVTIGEHQATIDGLNSEVNKLNNRIADLENEVATGGVSDEEVQEMQANLDQLEAIAKDLESRVGDTQLLNQYNFDIEGERPELVE